MRNILVDPVWFVQSRFGWSALDMRGRLEKMQRFRKAIVIMMGALGPSLGR